jgi:hypothetical protein
MPDKIRLVKGGEAQHHIRCANCHRTYKTGTCIEATYAKPTPRTMKQTASAMTVDEIHNLF